MARVLLVDHNESVLKNVRAVLLQEGLDICGEAATGRQAIEEANRRWNGEVPRLTMFARDADPVRIGVVVNRIDYSNEGKIEFVRRENLRSPRLQSKRRLRAGVGHLRYKNQVPSSPQPSCLFFPPPLRPPFHSRTLDSAFVPTALTRA